MKRKRLWAVIAAVVVMAAACGGGDDTDDNDSSDTTVPAADTEPGAACTTAQAAVTQLFEQIAAVADQPAAVEQVLGQTIAAETAAETACSTAQHAAFISELKNYHSSCGVLFAEYNQLFNQISITAGSLADVANNIEVALAVKDSEALLSYLQPKDDGIETWEQLLGALAELDARTVASACPGKDQAVFGYHEVAPFLARTDMTLTAAYETFTTTDCIFLGLGGDSERYKELGCEQVRAAR